MTVTEAKHLARRQEWQKRIMECRSSGEPVQKWCAAHQTSAATYYRWEREIFRKIEKKESAGRVQLTAGPEFMEIGVAAQDSVAGQAIMTVRIGGIAVDIYAGAREEDIQMVCRVLRLC